MTMALLKAVVISQREPLHHLLVAHICLARSLPHQMRLFMVVRV